MSLDDPYSVVARILREAREAASVTQTELADRLHKPQSYVSKYESAERRLDVVELLAICDALNLDVASILVALRKRPDAS